VLAALGEVARDFRKAAQHAVFVVQRADDDVGPEARAVGAHAPALVLEPPQARGLPQLDGRPIAVARLLRIEIREMLADDLVGLVALDALGALVPGLDDPLRVEDEDRVVLDALDERLEEGFPADARQYGGGTGLGGRALGAHLIRRGGEPR
jgi:hypothetical protein